MRKKLLMGLFAFSMLICSLLSFCACGEKGIYVNGKSYETFDKALEAVNNSTGNIEIKLYNDVIGGGIVVPEGKEMTVDLNGHTYTINDKLVGSTGTETNAFQLLKTAKVTFKNGTLKQGNPGCKIFLQNYSDLTLDSVTVDATTSTETGANTCKYAVSNNFGSLTVKGKSKLIAADGESAFDLWYGMSADYDNGINIVFDKTFTGSVKGMIQYGGSARATTGWEDKTKLEIKGGTFDIGQIVLTRTTSPNIKISGGSFDIDVTSYLENGYKCTETGGRYVVSKI